MFVKLEVRVNDLNSYSVRDELNRKTFETLEWLFAAIENGKMTEDQFSVAIDALFMAVSGLVDSDFINIITNAQKTYAKHVWKRTFVKPGHCDMVQFSLTVGEEKVITTKRQFGMAVGGSIREFDNSKDAFKWMLSIGEPIEKKGWSEI
jgi:hypothetical protein